MLFKKTLIVIGVAVALSQCGFKPMLSSENGEILKAFQQIDIPVIANREGQIMRNELKKMFYVEGPSDVKRYELRVTTSSSDRNMSYLSDQTAGRKNVTVTAKYTLYDIENKKILTSGSLSRQGYYTVSTASSFGTIISAERVKMDAVLLVARDMRVQIANYFMKHPEVLPEAPVT